VDVLGSTGFKLTASNLGLPIPSVVVLPPKCRLANLAIELTLSLSLHLGKNWLSSLKDTEAIIQSSPCSIVALYFPGQL
jgi:hypothetical protein